MEHTSETIEKSASKDSSVHVPRVRESEGVDSEVRKVPYKCSTSIARDSKLSRHKVSESTFFD